MAALRLDRAGRILVATSLLVLWGCGRNVAPTAPTAAPPQPIVPVAVSQHVYELTFAFDPVACSGLPAEAHQRTYTTTLVAGAGLATLKGGTFVKTVMPYSAWDVLYTRVSDTSAELWFQDPPIWEALSDESYLLIYGDARGEISGGQATLPFWAKIEYCPEREEDDYPECEVTPTTCESRAHVLTLRMK